MDPTNKKQPKSTTKPHKHPTEPDPTIASSTIHNISKHFSKLYTNHHKVLASSKPSNPPSKPRIETHFQAKSMAISAIEAKSSHPHRRTAAEMEKDRLRVAITRIVDNKSSPKESHESCDIKKAFVSGKTDKVKKLSMKESHEVRDIKKSSASLSRSLESGLKEAREGNDMKRPSFSLAAGGRRRSFCNSQTELADFFSCTGVKVVSVDMPPFMQVHAVDCARKAYDSLEKFTSKTLALTLKKEFDGVYGPAWHCIVGTSFGSFVTHSVGGFLYFSMDHKLYILLFKTTVQRAD